MGFIVFMIMIVALVLFVMIRGALDEKKAKEAYLKALSKQYGVFSKKSIKPEEMEKISKKYVRHKQEKDAKGEEEKYFDIDDITWNDLEMDLLFAQMNTTQSAAGAESLYMMLRRPFLEKEPLERLEKDIAYVTEQADQRVAIQMICRELGSTGKYSIFEYIDYLTKAEKQQNSKHIALLSVLCVAIILLFINPTVGMILLLISACTNVMVYLKTKQRVIPYLTGFSYIMRLLKSADSLIALDKEGTSGSTGILIERLQENRKAMDTFQKHAFLVSGMNQASGSPLQVVLDYFFMLTHLDLIKFNQMMLVLQQQKEHILALLDDVGYLDAVIAISSYRKALEVSCIPQFGKREGLEMKACIHPMIPKAVTNDFSGERGILVTGSNASGKSTFLKTVALNVILAQTIHTVAATEYSGGMYRVYTSMALRDNLFSKDSYYMVEIKALKRILDEAKKPSCAPLLCFVDEVLRGTNTVERIAASTQILRQLAQLGSICFAATHDVELTHLLESLYDNYHFKEEIQDNDIYFSYKLLKGRAHTRNAIKLLGMIGFEEQMITEAEALAAKFLETNQW